MTAMASNAESSESLEFLISMMGNIDPKVAQRVLDKFNGDVDKAADSLLSGEANYAEPYVPPPSSPANNSTRLGSVQPGTIDLTGMDEDPPPDPNWAVVRSNVAVDNKLPVQSQLDAVQNDDINRAIEESLAYAGSVEEIEEELSPEARVRKDNRPVVLRPPDQKHAHVGLLWQALFFVPQVRERIAAYRGPVPVPLTPTENGIIEVEPPTEGPEGQVWSLVELYGYLEMATLAELTGMPALSRFELSPWSNILLGAQTCDMLKELMWVIETALTRGLTMQSPNWPRLFHSRVAPRNQTPEEHDMRPINDGSDVSVITINYNDDNRNDLISCLATQLSPKRAQGSIDSASTKGEVLTAPADVLAFYPVRDEGLPSYSTSVAGKKGERTKFRFPMSFFLDRFVQENEVFVQDKVRLEKEASDEIQRLTLRSQGLTRHNDKDTVANLRTSIDYYEHIADPGPDPQRKAVLETMTMKLKKILTRLEDESAAIDKQISNLKAQSRTLFDCADLRRRRYDLRAVLMHDGLYGRKHIYSYIQQDGIWWKTLDHAVTQVSEETVLNDKSGLHLGTGPYLLLYSRSIPEDLRNVPRQWPDVVKEGARRDSENFLNELPQEIRAQVYNPLSSEACPSSQLSSPGINDQKMDTTA